jgi:hypothetical protein
MPPALPFPKAVIIPDENTGAGFARNRPTVTDAAVKRRCVSHNNGTAAGGDSSITGD